jgi:SAM-dependent methyltransferase
VSGKGAPSVGVAIQRGYRRRVALLLASAVLVLAATGAIVWTVTAIEQVSAVEAERDSWQRPADVLQALELRKGAVVADLGSGVGYFALKLAKRVGRGGRVLAVDVRRFPLVFLRVRALLRGLRNLETVHGAPDDPQLPAGGVDAVLVANTFHELEDQERILGRVRDALRPAGRLVLVDPAPSVAVETAGGKEHHRQQSPDSAETRLRQSGFEIVSRNDGFVDASSHGRWWLIVARKP